MLAHAQGFAPERAELTMGRRWELNSMVIWRVMAGPSEGPMSCQRSVFYRCSRRDAPADEVAAGGLELLRCSVFQPSHWGRAGALGGLSSLQSNNLFGNDGPHSSRTLCRACWLLSYLPLEFLCNLNHQVVLANSSPISF